ncbi:hypothetical protein PGT21_033864 [Puccinia graminis f. sp. tritici]|uniref:Tet-like 2OG-Fe(II) oxygenase domain-containing protein n=1 Tax=Puccinia graminis f. sp. tritici TaxID=56615 RepID=A0A5B0MQP0_PUCGR|nr:hypothetical protein PGT21_033864 [Puccinia graminis f. sp. tritici]
MSVTKAYLKWKKNQCRMKKKADQRQSQVSLAVDETTALPKTDPKSRASPITWSNRRHQEVNLYPHNEKPKANDDPNRKPTADEIKYALDLAGKFYYFGKGKIALLDEDNQYEVIALIEFIPFEKLSEKEKTDLNTVALFLNSVRKFVNTVGSDSRSWGGNMWMVGWRKAMQSYQLFGRYRDKKAIAAARGEYDKLMKESSKSSNILGKMFQDFANVAFEEDRELMKKFGIPAFASLDFDSPLEETDCAPNISFTRNEFFNPSHFDKDDLSEFAFGLFFPISRASGEFAGGALNSDISGGNFVFPDLKCGINFGQQNGIVKMVWRARDYRHCTLPSTNIRPYTRSGISLQINKKAASTARDIRNGTILKRPSNRGKDPTKFYYGDHQTYMNNTGK